LEKIPDMENCIFFINERFRVDSSLNEITDLQNDRTTKLEPRVIKVLVQLVEKAGELVTRTEFIEKIWDNYPGASEALNQSISNLRKALSDDEKKIVRTIAKSGYSFNGSLKEVEKPVNPKTRAWNPIVVSIITISFVLTAITYFTINSSHREAITSIPPGPKDAETAKIYARLDSIHQAETLKTGK
jgi:DNA-binding winged helix-turn-helix (wHTH) protein